MFEEFKQLAVIDYLIIAMLYSGESKIGTARKLGVSRTFVYNTIDRSKELLVKLELLDISQK